MEKTSQKKTVEELESLYKDRVNKLDDYRGSHPYYIMTDFGDEFPHDMSCYDIADILRKAPGLITNGIMEDHESSCCYYNFKTRKSANSFCKRLAKFLKKRTEAEKTCRTQWGF